MKTLIVYYSFEGNVAYLAEKLQQATGADLLRLEPKQEPPRKGFAKFVWGGKSVVLREVPELAPLRKDVASYDTLIIAYPVWAGSYPPAIRAFLAQQPFSGKSVYAIASSASGNAAKSFSALSKAIGANAAADANALKGTLSVINPLRNKERITEQLAAFVTKHGLQA